MAPYFLFGLLLTILALTSAKNIHGDNRYGVMGGEIASITELPHQVYITQNGPGFWCGGSIISARHILSTASCYSQDLEFYVVAATADGSSGGDNYTIAKITKHPNYPSTDIAVIELAKEIKLSEKAKTIALAGPKYKIKDGAELIASGWGVSEDMYRTYKLKKVTISKVSDEECKDTFDDINISEQFCAGGEGKKACMHDEGGPLIERTAKGNILVGVINKPTYCFGDEINKPSVFAKVSQFNKWIKEIVQRVTVKRKVMDLHQ